MKVGPLVKEEGCKKVLVHYGGQSAKKSGLLDRVCEALKDFDIDYVTLGGVVPNPHLSKVYEGIELCKKEGVDFILAVGGAEIMWCGSLSHNGLTGCGICGGDWATHLIEHELGGMFDVAHRAGLAAVWESWARYVMDEKPERFAQFAVDVMGVEESDDVKSTALKGIEAVEEFYRMIEMPTNMKELGI